MYIGQWPPLQSDSSARFDNQPYLGVGVMIRKYDIKREMGNEYLHHHISKAEREDNPILLQQ